MITGIEVLEANADREADYARILVVAVYLRLAEGFAELVVEAFNRRVARVEGVEVLADRARATVAARVDLRVHAVDCALVEDVEDLGLEEDLDGLADEEGDVQGEVAAVNVVGEISVTRREAVGVPERRAEIAWIVEPPVVAATREAGDAVGGAFSEDYPSCDTVLWIVE